jgi:ABC-type glutathione transport system ATPase component
MENEVGAELWTRKQGQGQRRPSAQPESAHRRGSAAPDAIPAASEPAEDEGVRLDVVNVSYSLKINGKLRPLLRNVSFRVLPGELCALMGSSGAGKR